MGEARYYMKIRCKTEWDAMNILPDIERIIQEAIDAREFWEKNYNKNYWRKFATKFPIMREYLEFAGMNGRYLSGYLEFKDLENGEETPVRDGKDILYCALVSNTADWGPMCNYIEDRFECVEYADWTSTERADLFDLL